MNKSTIKAYLAVFATGLILFTACAEDEPLEPLQVGSNPDLAAHSAEFKQEVIKVTGGVYVAVGFGLANSVLLEGDDGVVIVDTMESAEAAVPVKAAFNKITSKPVKAIIYTHFHPDHIQGATVMAGDNNPAVYSHEKTLYYLKRIASVTQWVKSLDMMRQFPAKYLVPHHTRPITGADQIYETLTNYRDAIQFVHDQTIYGWKPTNSSGEKQCPHPLRNLP